MSTPHWLLRPLDPKLPVPPALEYESVLTWVAAWPEGAMVVLEGYDGAITTIASREALVDALEMAPSVLGLFADAS